MTNNEPQFPLYVPSKGRSAYMITSRALTRMGVRHTIVVEPDEMDAYRAAVAERELLADVVELDMAFKERYEYCDAHGLEKSSGPGPARNFIWHHAIASGAARHWVMDDNIATFMRLTDNMKHPVRSGVFFRMMEDFVLRYTNVAMAGPNYDTFTMRRSALPPFVLNTRIYSCNLIRNDLPFRWRGRYNEDTILSLDMLKAGWCTIWFNAFVQRKLQTQMLAGGNTDEFYAVEGKPVAGSRYTDTGTVEKSRMLARVHPDCATVVWKFHRVHHRVDYGRFKRQRLIRRADVVPVDYGLRLVAAERTTEAA